MTDNKVDVWLNSIESGQSVYLRRPLSAFKYINILRTGYRGFEAYREQCKRSLERHRGVLQNN